MRPWPWAIFSINHGMDSAVPNRITGVMTNVGVTGHHPAGALGTAIRLANAGEAAASDHHLIDPHPTRTTTRLGCGSIRQSQAPPVSVFGTQAATCSCEVTHEPVDLGVHLRGVHE
jgi:hypothetical protein